MGKRDASCSEYGLLLINVFNSAFHSWTNVLLKNRSSFSKIFYWRIIDLQYFVGFCHTSAWISLKYTYISPLLNLPPTPFHPSRLSQRAWFELPESQSKFLLAIFFTYGNLYVSVLLSVPQPLLPSLCPQLCSLCLHLIDLLWFNLNRERSERSSAGVEEAEKEEGSLLVARAQSRDGREVIPEAVEVLGHACHQQPRWGQVGHRLSSLLTQLCSSRCFHGVASVSCLCHFLFCFCLCEFMPLRNFFYS